MVEDSRLPFPGLQIHTFRNPDKIQVLEIRELIRGLKHVPMPQSKDGLIATDLDLVLRWYGHRTDYPDLDNIGRIRFVELKYRDSEIGYAQQLTFQPIAEYLKDWDRFDGFYVVNHSDELHNDETAYRIGTVELSSLEFCEWVKTPWSNIPRTF